MTVYYLRECGLLFGIFIQVSKSILEDYSKKQPRLFGDYLVNYFWYYK
jgi:hypothetical protein